MKKIGLKKVLGLGLGAALLTCSALSHAANDQIPVGKTIKVISTYEHFAIMSLDSPVGDNQNCLKNPNLSHHVTIDMRNGKNKEVYAAALAAATSGQKVGFGISGCDLDRPKIYRIDVAY